MGEPIQQLLHNTFTMGSNGKSNIGWILLQLTARHRTKILYSEMLVQYEGKKKVSVRLEQPRKNNYHSFMPHVSCFRCHLTMAKHSI